MKRIAITFCAATMLLLSCNNGENKSDATKSSNDTLSATATDKKDEPWVPIDQAVMMQKMMEYATPGPMHTMMASWNGTWGTETTSWNFAGDTASKSTGTGVNTMIIGGKYQSAKYSGNMMGMSFEGLSIIGYDNFTKKFNSSWIDTWGTGIINMTGDWDAATKTITFVGSYPDMFRPGKECKMRETFKVVDDNTHQMEMYGPDPKTGKEYKMMEIKMSRKK